MKTTTRGPKLIRAKAPKCAGKRHSWTGERGPGWTRCKHCETVEVVTFVHDDAGALVSQTISYR